MLAIMLSVFQMQENTEETSEGVDIGLTRPSPTPMSAVSEPPLEADGALRSFILLGEMRKSFRGRVSEWKRKGEEQVWRLKRPPEVEASSHTIVRMTLPC